MTSAYRGSLKYATGDGDAAKFTFTGHEVAWIAPTDVNRGKAEVLVDGIKVTDVDLYSKSAKSRRIVFS